MMSINRIIEKAGLVLFLVGVVGIFNNPTIQDKIYCLLLLCIGLPIFMLVNNEYE